MNNYYKQINILDFKNIVSNIEDKPIVYNENWYYHSMIKDDIVLFEKILNEGLKCAYLRGKKQGGIYNGKYFISINKKNTNPNSSYNEYDKEHKIKFIIDNIKPIHAKFNFDKFYMLANTVLPIRSSGWEDEYHSFLRIKSKKIVAIEYSISYMLEENYVFDKEKLIFLKQIVNTLKELKKDLPIYDFYSNKEYNKEKLLSLKI